MNNIYRVFVCLILNYIYYIFFFIFIFINTFFKDYLKMDRHNNLEKHL